MSTWLARNQWELIKKVMTFFMSSFIIQWKFFLYLMQVLGNLYSSVVHSYSELLLSLAHNVFCVLQFHSMLCFYILHWLRFIWILKCSNVVWCYACLVLCYLSKLKRLHCVCESCFLLTGFFSFWSKKEWCHWFGRIRSCTQCVPS